MSDDITTIFVVGFPDDMKEREFQNMFTFSPGFEAATLKIPSPEETDKDSPQKKQIIGFAKFHSRLEALEARDILTGRKVDAEKNCVLKAEMAKKNLHTKRGLASLGLSTALANTFGLDTPNTGLSLQQQAGPLSGSVAKAVLTAAAANRPENLRISAAARTFNPFNDGSLASAPILGANGQRSFSAANPQFTQALASGLDSAAATLQVPGTAAPTVNKVSTPRRVSVHCDSPVSAIPVAADGSVPVSQKSQSSESADGDASVALADQPPRTPGAAAAAALQAGLQRPSVLNVNALQSQLTAMSLGTPITAASLLSPMSIYSAGSTPVGMVIPMATTRSVNSNDQNPPCNTLYVGNLPIGTKEEEIRQIFMMAPGFKRMSFRAKPNSGPMCFVEFDSIDFATLAMRQLDGQLISNSVGGGVRLSYSKNPLGVRTQNNPANPANGLNAAAAAAVAAAMANGGYIPNGANYGYSVAAALQAQQLGSASPLPNSAVPAAASTGNSSPTGSTHATAGAVQQQSGNSSATAGNASSIPSSHSASPVPSPTAATAAGASSNVPKDALSFLHQPIHQLHKQAAAANDAASTGSATPPHSTNAA